MMGRTRNGKGYLELKLRVSKSPVWVFNYFTYKKDKRIHRSVRLGSMEELPNDQAAEAAAEDFRHRMRIGPRILRYDGQVPKSAKAHCTAEEYMAMFTNQQGRCSICGAMPARLCLDHDHTTGKSRGLLCGRCNSGIGLLGDDPEILRRAADYIEEHVIKDLSFRTSTCTSSNFEIPGNLLKQNGAGDRDRTGDIQLGK